MLTFYPEFEAESIVDNEIIFCLDCSNSMKVLTLVCKINILNVCYYYVYTYTAL